MTSKNEASDTVAESLEANLAGAENLHVQLRARIEERAGGPLSSSVPLIREDRER